MSYPYSDTRGEYYTTDDNGQPERISPMTCDGCSKVFNLEDGTHLKTPEGEYFCSGCRGSVESV